MQLDFYYGENKKTRARIWRSIHLNGADFVKETFCAKRVNRLSFDMAFLFDIMPRVYMYKFDPL